MTVLCLGRHWSFSHVEGQRPVTSVASHLPPFLHMAFVFTDDMDEGRVVVKNTLFMGFSIKELENS